MIIFVAMESECCDLGVVISAEEAIIPFFEGLHVCKNEKLLFPGNK